MLSVHFNASPCQAQAAESPQSTPFAQAQEPIKIHTEEILLPVVATDSNGRFDPTLEADDLLILEDGQPQTIRSVRRISASVLLLLDTGGFRNPAMKTNATRELALRLVSQLRPGDQVAALQFGGKVELLQSWTARPEVFIHSLKSKLSSGRGGRLKDGLAAAAAQLNDAQIGNRHVVLVTDGGESTGENPALQDAVKRLFASQATVHVISYTLLGRKSISKRHPKYWVTITSEKRKSANDVSDELTRPNDLETLEAKLKTQVFLVVETDFKLWKHSREYVKTLKQNEQWLAWLAERSGGTMMLPTSTEELPKLIDDLAREIDSQYVVTYRPKIGVALNSTEQLRHIEVASRRVGLNVHTRRSYLVRTAP